MKFSSALGFEFDFRKLLLFASLLIFPNLLASFHFSIYGFRIHFFQYLIFIAAFIYGPFGGMLSGGFGSLFTAMALKNPYIIVGNMILGGFAGYFMKKKMKILPAVLLAFAVQAPWLWATDVYLAGMPSAVVAVILASLFAGNIICAVLAGMTAERIRGLFF